MHQTIVRQYENACMMLMRRENDNVFFLGTAFLVHEDGYLVTASHLVNEDDDLVIAHASQGGGYTHLGMETVVPIPVEVVNLDPNCGIALLKFAPELQLGVPEPDTILGNPETIQEGDYLLSFGVSFGHVGIHNVFAMHAMLSAKLYSMNETKILLFDKVTHAGTMGGPLVHSEEGRIVGVIQGLFDPLMITGRTPPEDFYLESRIAYAVTIDYLEPMLEAEGVVIDRSPGSP